jgi:demethylmenaquinone methyltransferase/2-methoxy-6-polyprenyl-1,4-benzoquinol methylase
MAKKKAPLAKLNDVDLSRSSEKRAYNRSLFRVVAPAYGKITRVLSLDQDRRWKQILIGGLPDLEAGARCLDLACGPGDLSEALAARYPRAGVIGVDLSAEMLEMAKGLRERCQNLSVARADMQSLPLGDRSCDIVTGGYAIRNAPSLAATLREIHRVLKPGGRAAFLDFSTPPSRLSRAAVLLLLRLWGNLWGTLFHGKAEVYGYIAKSLADFPDRAALTALLSDCGLETVETRYFFCGMLEVRLVERTAS